eukprot:TRINITY_DN2202_c0_g1_i1.p1 TRINITY_DN2202_c0_g1~~TRINITY_DN2202_c0_g1_i1.p1  ORF type:complete len:248 (-),score=43.17 TRINITY_DN2202_c0_g1_i1:76-819(-)
MRRGSGITTNTDGGREPHFNGGDTPSTRNSRRASGPLLVPCPEKQGWLTKQGGNYKTWKRRWFVLRNYQLMYYGRKQAKASAKPAGLIHFKNIDDIETDIDLRSKDTRGAKKGKPLFKIIVNTHRGNYMIQGDNSAETEEWIEVLKRTLATFQRARPLWASMDLRLIEGGMNETFDDDSDGNESDEEDEGIVTLGASRCTISTAQIQRAEVRQRLKGRMEQYNTTQHAQQTITRQHTNSHHTYACWP